MWGKGLWDGLRAGATSINNVVNSNKQQQLLKILSGRAGPWVHSLEMRCALLGQAL